ncbi:hypothetical protein MKFW12EY_43900 (plasmid) [Methylomonas koyamae]|nr:hypothetical protein MKFW12EY_43900 [Methylomonas koyamae]
MDTVATARKQKSKFNDSFQAMCVKSGRSPVDPKRPVTLLQTGQSAKARFCKLEGYKAAVGAKLQIAHF